MKWMPDSQIVPDLVGQFQGAQWCYSRSEIGRSVGVWDLLGYDDIR